MSLLRSASTSIANQARYEHLNAFISRASGDTLKGQAERADAQHEQGSLNGRLIAVKDNICTEGLPTTAASGILRTFTSPHDATVVSLLRNAGALIAGKTNLDEFGMGSHSVNSYFGPVMQHIQSTAGGSDGSVAANLSAGGSSGGSAVAVATDQCWAALGTDTGGSVRLPAAYTGTVGFKPSYGLLSRWGVIAYANSLDTVGILSRNVPVVRSVFEALNQYDPKDPTSLRSRTRAAIAADTSPATKRQRTTLRVGVPAEYSIAELSAPVRLAWAASLRHLAAHHAQQQQGPKPTLELVPVSLPSTQQSLSAYYVLAPAEASSNLAKYDGVRYGSRAAATDTDTDAPDASPGSVLFARTRGAGLGDEVRRRILLGAYTLSATAMDNYFIQAQRVRRLVQRDFDAVFAAENPLLCGGDDTSSAGTSSGQTGAVSTPHVGSGVDVLIHPTAPTLPPSVAEANAQPPLEGYTNDVFTVPASLAGLPAVSVPVPCGDGQVCGMQVVGQFGQDALVLDVAELLHDACSGAVVGTGTP